MRLSAAQFNGQTPDGWPYTAADTPTEVEQSWEPWGNPSEGYKRAPHPKKWDDDDYDPEPEEDAKMRRYYWISDLFGDPEAREHTQLANGVVPLSSSWTDVFPTVTPTVDQLDSFVKACAASVTSIEPAKAENVMRILFTNPFTIR